MFVYNYQNYLTKAEFKTEYNLSCASDIKMCSVGIYSSFVPTIIFGIIEQLISSHNIRDLDLLKYKCQKYKQGNGNEMKELNEFLKQAIDTLKSNSKEISSQELLSQLYENKKQIEKGIEALTDQITDNIFKSISDIYRIKVLEYFHNERAEKIVIKSESQFENYWSVVRIVKLNNTYHLLYEFNINQMDAVTKMIKGVRNEYQKDDFKYNSKGESGPMSRPVSNQYSRPVSSIRPKHKQPQSNNKAIFYETNQSQFRIKVKNKQINNKQPKQLINPETYRDQSIKNANRKQQEYEKQCQQDRMQVVVLKDKLAAKNNNFYRTSRLSISKMKHQQQALPLILARNQANNRPATPNTMPKPIKCMPLDIVYFDR